MVVSDALAKPARRSEERITCKPVTYDCAPPNDASDFSFGVRL